MDEASENKKSYPWHLVAVVLTASLAIAAGFYYPGAGRFYVFQNLFYFPIIIACIYYLKKGFVFSLLLAVFYFAVIVGYTRDLSVIGEAFVRVVLFGAVAGMVTMISLQRKRAEEALEESERKYRLVFERAGEGILVFEAEGEARGKIIAANGAAASMHGYTRDELLALKITDLDVPDSAASAPERCERALEGEWVRGELTHIRKDGAIFPLEISAGLLHMGRRKYIITMERDITERKLLEEKLDYERRQLLSLLNSIDDLIYISDPHTYEILYANDASVRTLGKNPVGGLCYRELQGSDLPCGFCTNEIILKDKDKAYRWEYHNPTVNLDLEITDRIIKWPDGREVRFEFAKNITERKRAEEALLESQQILQTVLDTIPVRVFWKDRDLRYLGCNKPFALDSGLHEPEELIGKDDYAMAWRDRAELYRADDKQVIETGIPKLLIEEPETTPEGQTIWVMTNKTPLRNSTGSIEGVLGTYMDITDYRKTVEALRESEERYNGFFRTSRDCVFITTKDGRWVDLNDAALELFGYSSRDELMQVGVTNLYARPEERAKHIALITEHGYAKEFPVDLLKKDGTVMHALITSVARYDKENNLIGYQGTIRDITEQKRVEARIRKLNEELEQKVAERTQQLLDAQTELVRREKFAVLGQLAGTVGHQLRNPLGVINNAVYFLKMTMTGADDAVREYLDIIMGEVDVSRQIISDLIDLTNPRAPQVIAVAVKQLVSESLGKCDIPANVGVETDIPDALPDVGVDPFQICRVVQNLITNAVQAMSKGGVLRMAARQIPGAIGWGSEVREHDLGSIEISVTDTGEGISPENMKRLFQPLFTTRARGIGMGLTACKNLTEANGGSIEVKSRVGEGTVFTVRLPCKSIAGRQQDGCIS